MELIDCCEDDTPTDTHENNENNNENYIEFIKIGNLVLNLLNK